MRLERAKKTSRRVIRQLADTTTGRGTPGGEQLLLLRAAANSEEESGVVRDIWKSKSTSLINARVPVVLEQWKQAEAVHAATVLEAGAALKRQREVVMSEVYALQRLKTAAESEDISSKDAVVMYHIVQPFVQPGRQLKDLEDYMGENFCADGEQPKRKKKNLSMRLSGAFIRKANTVHITSDAGQVVMTDLAQATATEQEALAVKHYQREDDINTLEQLIGNYISSLSA